MCLISCAFSNSDRSHTLLAYLIGNRPASWVGIIQLKKENKESYKTLCRYVDVILEQYCINGMPNPRLTDKDGCYIKGSKVIYIKPERQNTDLIIQKRAEILKKYSAYSKKFWDSYSF